MRVLLLPILLMLCCATPGAHAQGLTIPGLDPSSNVCSDPTVSAPVGVWGPDKGPIMVEIEDYNQPTLEALKTTIDQVKAAGHKKITIRINSYGGDVDAGMKMIQALEDSGLQTTCVVDTKAVSMGFFQLESCGERLMTGRSYLMAHQPWTKAVGNADQLEQQVESLRVLTSALIDTASARMGMTKADFMKKIQNKEWWMDKDEALKAHAVDGLVDPKDLPQLYQMQIRKPSLLEMLGL